MQKGLLPPVDQKRVLRSINDNFAATYLALLGIIQSVVLGILITNIAGLVDKNKYGDAFVWTSGFLTFMIVVLVWYSYQWYPYLDRWPPRLLDSVIPFSLGISQGILASSSQEEATYFLGISLTGLFGVVAYLNTRKRINKNDFNPVEVYNHHLRHLNISIFLSGGASFYGLVIFVCIKFHWPLIFFRESFFLIPVILSVFAMFYVCSYYLKKILEEFKIEE